MGRRVGFLEQLCFHSLGESGLDHLSRFRAHRSHALFLGVSLFAFAWSGASAAQDQKPESLPQGGASPGSAASIPTDKPKLRAFCPDRPAQATLPCTVDKGHFQLESDLFNATYDRSGGTITDSYLFTNPTLKLGIADRTDIEVNISPYEEVRTQDPGSGVTHTLEGPGDLTVSLKRNFYGDYRGPLALAAEPFVTAPTGRNGIGAGGWEGGLILPIAAGISKSIVLNLTPQLRVAQNQQGQGVHLAPVEIVNVAWSLPANLTLATEIYAREDQNPTGVVTKCSADLGLALGLPNDLEVDMGANVGLNPQTAAVQGYLGFAKRF